MREPALWYPPTRPGWEPTPWRVANPAAGATASLVLAGDYEWVVLSAVWEFTSDANAANRFLSLQALADDGNPLLVAGAAIVVTANTTAQRFAGSVDRGVAEWAANTDILFPIPRLRLGQGMTLKINVTNIQATDQLRNIKFLFERYPTGPVGGFGGGE